MKAADADWPVTMIGHGDGMSGLVLAGGIATALLHRERTGIATVVDGSLMGSALWFNGLEMIAAQGVPTTGVIPGNVRVGAATRKLPGAGSARRFRAPPPCRSIRPPTIASSICCFWAMMTATSSTCVTASVDRNG